MGDAAPRPRWCLPTGQMLTSCMPSHRYRSEKSAFCAWSARRRLCDRRATLRLRSEILHARRRLPGAQLRHLEFDLAWLEPPGHFRSLPHTRQHPVPAPGSAGPHGPQSHAKSPMAAVPWLEPQPPTCYRDSAEAGESEGPARGAAKGGDARSESSASEGAGLKGREEVVVELGCWRHAASGGRPGRHPSSHRPASGGCQPVRRPPPAPLVPSCAVAGSR